MEIYDVSGSENDLQMVGLWQPNLLLGKFHIWLILLGSTCSQLQTMSYTMYWWITTYKNGLQFWIHFFHLTYQGLKWLSMGQNRWIFLGFHTEIVGELDSSSQDMVSALIYFCMSIILRVYFGYVQARDVSPYMIGCWWVVPTSEGQTCWHRKKPRRCQAQKGIGQLLTVSNGTTTLSPIFDLYLTCCCVTSVRNQERVTPEEYEWMPPFQCGSLIGCRTAETSHWWDCHAQSRLTRNEGFAISRDMFIGFCQAPWKLSIIWSMKWTLHEILCKIMP